MRGDSSSVRGVGGSELAQQVKEFTPNPKISVPHPGPTRWEERSDSCRLSASTVMCVHPYTQTDRQTHMHTDRHTCTHTCTHTYTHCNLKGWLTVVYIHSEFQGNQKKKRVGWQDQA